MYKEKEKQRVQSILKFHLQPVIGLVSSLAKMPPTDTNLVSRTIQFSACFEAWCKPSVY